MKKWQLWFTYGGYFVLIGLLNWQWRWLLAYWLLGGALGAGFELVDRLVYVYLTRPEDQLSLYVKHLLTKYRFKEVWSVLQVRRSEQKKLSSDSILFMMGWLVLSVYVITSTGSVIAMGLVMGIGWRFLLKVLVDWPRPPGLQEKYFWQVKRPLKRNEMKVVLAVIVLGFGWLTMVIVNL